MSANRALDEWLGGEDGISPIRFAERRHRRTRHPAPWRQAEPWRITARDNVRTVLEIVAGVAVVIEIGLAFYVWAWIAAASMWRP